MGNAYLDTSLVDKAIIFATNAHKNTERRGKQFPYILHCFEAMSIVASITNDPELLAAACLHDTIEDTEVTKEDLEKEFGHRVASLVAYESDATYVGKSEEETWKDRKADGVNRIKNGSFDFKIVALGDKLSNMRAIYQDYQKIGDEIWKLFHVKDKKEHEWRYRSLIDAFVELKDTNAYKEFAYLVNEVFKGE